jgi:hypothetical protein
MGILQCGILSIDICGICSFSFAANKMRKYMFHNTTWNTGFSVSTNLIPKCMYFSNVNFRISCQITFENVWPSCNNGEQINIFYSNSITIYISF